MVWVSSKKTRKNAISQNVSFEKVCSDLEMVGLVGFVVNYNADWYGFRQKRLGIFGKIAGRITKHLL